MQKKFDYQKSLLIFISLLLAVGIFFRLYNIDKKVYWHDEAYTSIRTAGYNDKEVVNLAFNGELIKVRDLLKYYSLTDEKTWGDSLEKLIEHPEHPPLYYLLSRAWQQLVGSSITATRGLSVIFSLLLFPLVYWLCQELFDSPQTGLWAIGTIAISPVQVLYAQEAREYSLLLVTTTLSCIALIGALKRNNWRWWGFYTISLAANLYVSLLGGYIAIAQAFYVFILEKFRFTKITLKFILSGIISLILFSPWLWVIYKNYSILKAKTSWSNMTRPFIELLRSWELHLTSTFIDFHPGVNGYISVRIIGFLAVFIFICYRFVYRRNQPRTWLLLLTLTVVPSLMLILPDLINGGIKSIMIRYFLPSLLAVQIVVAYWLSQAKDWQDWQRTICISLITFFGITSCLISSQSITWWNKIVGYHNGTIAAAINQYEKPLVITNTTAADNNNEVKVGVFMSLSYLLDNKVSLILFKNQNIPVVNPQQYSDVLLWNVNEESRNNFQAKNNCQLEMVEGEFYLHLWRMQPPEMQVSSSESVISSIPNSPTDNV